MENKSIITKKAVTYSLLAHINNSKKLSRGPLDIFIPIVKKSLHLMNFEGQFKGENISEISNYVSKCYELDIPLPVLRNILKLISQEINTADDSAFILHNDDSFILNKYVFEDFDTQIEESKRNVEYLQQLFKEFCAVNKYPYHSEGIIKFIDKNKANLSFYLANKPILNGTDYTIEAKFVEFFRNSSPEIYEQIKDIYLGSILTSYLDFQPVDLKLEVDLLFDTNFIVSLLDLNTPESTKTCRQLITIGESIGFKFHVLQDTIDEIKGLLRYKAENYNKSIVQSFVNKEDILNACHRLNLSKTDLERIADNIVQSIQKFNIAVVPHTDSLRNKARFSKEYNTLKDYRSSDKSALHDAMCIEYVKDKRENKPIHQFENVKCWWVNNSISHDIDSDGIISILNAGSNRGLPEIIKVDDLINILWLSSPYICNSTNVDFVDVGLTSLVAFTLNQNLPKARVIKELDENIQKYKDASISDRDVYLLSTRIANGQLKDIEKLNEVANKDAEMFKQRVREEAEKQNKIEIERGKRLEEMVGEFKKSVVELQQHKKRIDEKNEIRVKEIMSTQTASLEKIVADKDKRIKELEEENIKQENENRRIKREAYIKKHLKKWRQKTWIPLIIVSLLGVTAIILMNNLSFDFEVSNDLNDNTITIIITFITMIIDAFLIHGLYDKYFNLGNIEQYKKDIDIPSNLKEIE